MLFVRRSFKRGPTEFVVVWTNHPAKSPRKPQRARMDAMQHDERKGCKFPESFIGQPRQAVGMVRPTHFAKLRLGLVQQFDQAIRVIAVLVRKLLAPEPSTSDLQLSSAPPGKYRQEPKNRLAVLTGIVGQIDRPTIIFRWQFAFDGRVLFDKPTHSRNAARAEFSTDPNKCPRVGGAVCAFGHV
jgi:hypothetical protein